MAYASRGGRAAGIVAALLGGLATFSPREARAGPPLLSGDPETPDDGRWEVNVAARFDGTARALDLEVPALDVNYGIGELHAELADRAPSQLFLNAGPKVRLDEHAALLFSAEIDLLGEERGDHEKSHSLGLQFPC